MVRYTTQTSALRRRDHRWVEPTPTSTRRAGLQPAAAVLDDHRRAELLEPAPRRRARTHGAR